MTAPQKQFVRDNFFNLSTFIALLSFIVYQSRWQAHVDSHIEDQNIHMQYQELVRGFTPRVEIDSRLDIMQKSLERIESKMDNKKDKE